MKRTAAAFVLLAGLGAGCSTTDQSTAPVYTGPMPTPTVAPGYMGPHGTPVQAMPVTRGQEPGGVIRADGKNVGKGGLKTVSNPGYYDEVGMTAKGTPVPVGNDGTPGFYPGRGVLPVPAMGPYGAVAAVGALPPHGLGAPIHARTSIRFGEPQDMRITWYGPTGLSDTVLTTPARYNFAQGGIYRLKLSNIAGRAGVDLYPTVEVVPATAKTATFLAHSSVPISFTDEDFEQVLAGNFLVKVIYLPDPQYQDLAAVAGPVEVISTRLEPGVDPIAEARRRGEILAIVRMGNIDLDVKGSPPLDAPNPFAGPPPVGPPPMTGPVPGVGPTPPAKGPMPAKLP
jgi:hypothetical protein